MRKKDAERGVIELDPCDKEGVVLRLNICLFKVGRVLESEWPETQRSLTRALHVLDLRRPCECGVRQDRERQTSLGALALRTTGCSAPTSTSSSIRMPRPWKCLGNCGSAGTYTPVCSSIIKQNWAMKKTLYWLTGLDSDDHPFLQSTAVSEGWLIPRGSTGLGFYLRRTPLYGPRLVQVYITQKVSGQRTNDPK